MIDLFTRSTVSIKTIPIQCNVERQIQILQYLSTKSNHILPSIPTLFKLLSIDLFPKNTSNDYHKTSLYSHNQAITCSKHFLFGWKIRKNIVPLYKIENSHYLNCKAYIELSVGKVHFSLVHRYLSQFTNIFVLLFSLLLS